MSGPSGTESDETRSRRGLGATTGETGVSGDVVARAKAALEGVTPGPWESIYHQHDTSYRSDTCNVITERTGDLVAEVDDESRGYEEPHGEFGRDAAFIAAARSLVPELVAEVERLRAALPDPEDLWDAQQCVQDWRDCDNANDTRYYRKRWTDLAKRLRAASNAATAVKP